MDLLLDEAIARMKFKLLCGILAWFAVTGALAQQRGELPLAQDFTVEARVAKANQLPIMVLFSSPDCHYCERVRQEFLIPMTRNAEYDAKVIMRQVEIGSDAALRDFSGRVTTHGDFALLNKIHMVPTVKFFDAQGRELAAPIIGLLTPDFYGGYLDQAIDQSLARIRAAPRTTSN